MTRKRFITSHTATAFALAVQIDRPPKEEGEPLFWCDLPEGTVCRLAPNAVLIHKTVNGKAQIRLRGQRISTTVAPREEIFEVIPPGEVQFQFRRQRVRQDAIAIGNDPELAEAAWLQGMEQES